MYVPGFARFVRVLRQRGVPGKVPEAETKYLSLYAHCVKNFGFKIHWPQIESNCTLPSSEARGTGGADSARKQSPSLYPAWHR